MAFQVGDHTDGFELPVASGGHKKFDPTGHTATVLIWTCNHCPYALAWHDRIQAVINDYKDKDVVVYQINANDEEKYPDDSFEKDIERYKNGDFAGEYFHDAEQTLSKHWGAKVTPDVFVMNKDGVLSYRGAPDSDHEDPSQNASYLRDALDDLIAGVPVRLPETKVRGCSVKWIINDQPNPYI
jgi:hypothetical protein